MPKQQILPTWLALNACNDTSANGLADIRLGAAAGAAYGGGLNLGDYFDLTTAEAKQLSDTAIGTLYAGRYRRIQVDSAATAANIVTGAIGLMLSAAGGVNIITSYDKGLSPNVRPVVFLNAITPGNYGFIQELGIANVLAASSISVSPGTAVDSTTGGVVTSGTSGDATQVGVSLVTTTTGSKVFLALLKLPVVQD